MTTRTRGQMWLGMLRQRCPQCLEGKIYKKGLDMNPSCPVCGLVFEREPGYFIGSMYISYGMASVCMLLFTGLGWLLFPEIELHWLMLGAIALFLPLAPMCARYARVIWIYFDRWVWPPPEEGS